jgi:Zn-dependent protease
MMAALYEASTWVIPVVLAITLHEAAHGYVAWKLGDDTAYRLGRVSFNPIRHIDLFGTLVLPALLMLARSPFLFGYAKPVPVAFWRLRNARWGMVAVALAGPGINLVLAIAAALAIRGLLEVQVPREWLPGLKWGADNLFRMVDINIILAVFNMLPIPPLDGGRVLTGLLPEPFSGWLAGFERKGMLILIALLFILPFLGHQIGVDLIPLAWAVGTPAGWLSQLMLTLTGLEP